MATEVDQSIVAQAPAEDLAAKLEQLKASATKQYSLKNYPDAAECYSEAAEIQDQLYGEMSLENADLLYQYGRCLYHVAIENSDVLGGKVAGTSDEPKRKKRKVAPTAESSGGAAASVIGDAIKDGEQRLAEDVVEAAVEDKDGMLKPAASTATTANKPYFQITGDENWTDSEDDADEDGDAAAGGDGAEEEEDDFATAYEILDMARVLLSRKVEALQQEKGKGKGKGKSSEEGAESRQLRERLADTHDLQAEISLENERFGDAINDTRAALALKLALYPEDSSLVAEAHYKLSLALEFASVTSTADGEGESKVAQVDEDMRTEAAKEMELAITSCRARVTKEEAQLDSLDKINYAAAKKSIVEVKGMIKDMEQRLVELRNPAVSLSGLQPAGAPGIDDDSLRGMLGAILGESKADQAKRIAEATETANDLSGLVKQKKKAKTTEPPADTKGKRKADEETPQAEGASTNGKKVKFGE